MKRFFSISRKRAEPADKKEVQQGTSNPSEPEKPTSAPTTDAAKPEEPPQTPPKPTVEQKDVPVTESPPAPAATSPTTTGAEKPKGHSKRFSIPIPSLRFTQRSDERKRPPTSSSSTKQDKPEEKKETPVAAPPPKPLTSAEKRAFEHALVVRSLIVGPTPDASKPVGPSELYKVKTELIQHPKMAQQIIAALRTLPGFPGTEATQPPGPIHAVCLPYTEQEAHDLHFTQLVHQTLSSAEVQATTDAAAPPASPPPPPPFPNVTTASIESLSQMLKNIKGINLLSTPDLGFGEPGSSPGILSGAVPTAETVLNGMQQITPALLALGFATGKSLTPDHTRVYPPSDRMSVLTYWWGFELVLPLPTLKYLSSAENITNAIINFLTALSLVDQGVREILPFVRYIGQFIDYEFDSIKRQDKGKGVICAATWVLPAILVARPWDFPTKPIPVPTQSVADPSASAAPVTPPAEHAAPPAALPQVVVTGHA